MIESAVKKAIAEQFGRNEETVNLDSPMSEYDADSLDLVELVMSIEDELHIEIPDEAFDALVSGADVAKLTGRQLVDVATKYKA
jgi:acyl carrier protein